MLVNGRLKFGQTIVLTGTEGPIVTTVKALLTPSKMQDLRVKCGYTEHKELMAAQGVGHRLNAQLTLFISFLLQVKIAAKELDKAIAGLSMRVANNPDEVIFINSREEDVLHPSFSSGRDLERGLRKGSRLSP